MKNRRARCQLAFLLLLFLLVILAALSVSVGSVSLSFQDIQAILSGADRESTALCWAFLPGPSWWWLWS